mmetsp:Transcript_6806/g.14025  ORF Transcript_6806/g.14025 Transcript_6806/m.14025 type:complete len:102 (+) Transcript_6806:74-379(+)|eukprot:CAMPEP_0197270030 /NCGR_PEP_ID=MMETSP1432-20130617/6557_1 /TAXON_ID=44447 /ORGANISM="Pseudo-nitzschia delicatissima, Strain UNC1205" /LENGTH=101 /DNA_ID=CAMNT_0042735273 /DNA_START=52 /DNA_END=357 /DNA_ORIENTATION=+
MTFSYGITTSASCDTTSSISSSEDQKRRSDSLDMDEIMERSNKRKKVCTTSSETFQPSSPIKIHGPFPGYRQSTFVGNVPFVPPPSLRTRARFNSKEFTRK